MLRGPPLKSETGWTGEFWLNRVLLILENYEDRIFLSKIFLLKFFKLKKKNEFFWQFPPCGSCFRSVTEGALVLCSIELQHS